MVYERELHETILEKKFADDKHNHHKISNII